LSLVIYVPLPKNPCGPRRIPAFGVERLDEEGVYDDDIVTVSRCIKKAQRDQCEFLPPAAPT
jgi:hypothetical protein